MNSTPLEDQVHDALHRRVDPLQHAPLTVTDVRRRAGRIQLRRRVAAGAAVAAVLAIAIPVGFSVGGPAQRGDVPPATNDPSPSVTGTVVIDPRSAEVVDSTPVPLVDVDAPSLITQDGTVTLPGPFSTITSYLDGWVGVAMDEATGTIQFLSAAREVEDSAGPTGGLVVSADGQRISWSEYDGSRWRVIVADPAGRTEWVYTTFPPSPQDRMVVPVGFVSEDEVAVRQYDNTGPTRTFVAGGGAPVDVPGFVQAEAASSTTGLVAGLTEIKADGSCWGVVDGVARTGTTIWDTCDYRLGSFSPDGSHLVGTAPDADNYGSPTLALLDATTGKPVVDFEVAGARKQVVGIWSQMAWEDDETLVVRVMTGDDYSIVRLGLDGTVQRVDIPSAGASGLSVAEVR